MAEGIAHEDGAGQQGAVVAPGADGARLGRQADQGQERERGQGERGQ
ncbi:hypothetical protein [Bordetella hinzii]|nr:hypothetical protein [Bordetella hinzii]MBZ0075315.1 hypothetical protein [Bordetella hinzii]MBZ0078348.1 hypothetical protein [Bordetella hinzii]